MQIIFIITIYVLFESKVGGEEADNIFKIKFLQERLTLLSGSP